MKTAKTVKPVKLPKTAKGAKAPKAAVEETRVELGGKAAFAVRHTRDCLSPQNPALADTLRAQEPFRRQRVLFLIDAGLAAAQPRVVEAAAAYASSRKASLVAAASPVVVEGGERAKNRPELCDWLRARLTGAGLDGESHVVAVGGGALLDAAGFAAGTLRRPPRVTRVPTTLLSQASAAYSPRSAVNAFGRKDALSVYRPPFAVLVDPKFLASLADRQKRAGLAEIVRTALACDADLFHWMIDHVRSLASFDRRSLETAARRAARAHCRGVAEGEPFGTQRVLPADFGLWATQRIEAEANGDLLHGEAVAAGTAVDLLLSVLLTGLPPASARAALELLSAFGLPLWHDVLGAADEAGAPALLSAVAEYATAATPSVPLLRGLGRGEPSLAISAEAAAAALEALRRWDSRGD